MEGIIFDVDGTLWDSTEQVAVAWNQAIREKTELDRVITPQEVKREFGKPMKQIIENMFPELDAAERDRLSVYLFQYENEWVEKAPCILYDRMQETIRTLSRRYQLFIVSNCQAGYIEAFLKNTDLGTYITDHVCPGDTGELKGENIRIIMQRNGIRTAVYVGDTQGDADACKEAGIPMIYAAYGFGEVAGDYPVIHSFAELAQMDYELL